MARTDPSMTALRHSIYPLCLKDPETAMWAALREERPAMESALMPKIRKSSSELTQMALAEIRTYRGCQDVGDVAIHPIIDDRADCNWSITVVDLGTAEGDLARRAAIETQERLSAQFDLFDQSAASEPSPQRGRRTQH